jgi:hypothetical protein
MKCQPITKKLAIGGLNGFVSTEVQNLTSVLRIGFSAKNPAHRQFSNRWVQFFVLTKIRIKDELSFPLGRNKTKNRHTTKKLTKKRNIVLRIDFCAIFEL